MVNLFFYDAHGVAEQVNQYVLCVLTAARQNVRLMFEYNSTMEREVCAVGENQNHNVYLCTLYDEIIGFMAFFFMRLPLYDSKYFIDAMRKLFIKDAWKWFARIKLLRNLFNLNFTVR